VSDAPLARARVVATGVVQGVFFRGSCRREALNRKVVGWVRNNPDGSVEAVFEGAQVDVDAVVNWMRQGPRLARVEVADVSFEQPEGLSGFRIF
jgi:acylphosphatase